MQTATTNITTKTFSAKPAEVKVWKSRLLADGPEVTQIRTPISSTSVDRDGDEFSLAGLQSMIPALKSGKIPLYLDHGYQENGTRLYGALNMIGAWIDGEIVGNTLYAIAFLEPGNWRGDDLARKMSTGLPIGFSAGFGVIKSRNRPKGGLIFDEVSLWEVSAVGIPSNPDAVTVALKSIRAAAGLEKGTTATKNPDDRRLVLIRMADGSRCYVTATAFRKVITEVCDEALAPLKEKIANVTVKKGVNRGRGRRPVLVTPYGRRYV